jgi:succinyl-CoA synthetase beta subunit
MATMDIIKLHGGEPANFLDVGGSVTEAQVLQAFQIITSDDKVNAVLVNIFGGIVNCATIAKGIIGAAEKANLKVPLVVRLEGTNATEARELLRKSGLKLHNLTDLDQATKKAVELAKEFKKK